MGSPHPLVKPVRLLAINSDSPTIQRSRNAEGCVKIPHPMTDRPFCPRRRSVRLTIDVGQFQDNDFTYLCRLSFILPFTFPRVWDAQSTKCLEVTHFTLLSTTCALLRSHISSLPQKEGMWIRLGVFFYEASGQLPYDMTRAPPHHSAGGEQQHALPCAE